MKKTSIKPIFVESIPERLEEGVLYISERYKTAIHKCCCGCGEEVVTPLSPADWSIKKASGCVSLMPSIGNWSFGCKSHYFIQNNKVIWAEKFSQWQIDFVKAKDKADKKSYIEVINQQKRKRWGVFFVISDLWKTFIEWLISR